MGNIVHPVDEFDVQYKQFQKREGIPVHTGYAVEDVRTVEVGDWERTGGRGAFINLIGMEAMCDAQIHEIEAGQKLKPQKHLHESINFVIKGSGVTSVGSEVNENTFEWSSGALFYVPRNTQYTHANVDNNDDARILSVTPLPLLYTLLQQDEPIWDIDMETYEQWDAIREDGFYSKMTEAKTGEGTGSNSRAYWESNFVPDVRKFDELEQWPERGAGGRSVVFPFRTTNMMAHMSEFPSGRYKKAHRHHPGANVLILTGSGYSLFWKEGDEERKRVDWKPYTLVTPPLMVYHQHFNTSETAARYLAIHAPQLGLRGSDNAAIEPLNPENQIEYENEDRDIRERFQQELNKTGVENQMDPELYQK